MRKLTPKQEAVVVDIASGMEPLDAYLRHYNWSGTKEAAAAEVRKLLNLTHVSARLKELRDAYATKVIEASRGAPSEEPARAYGVAEAMKDLDDAWKVAQEKENPLAMKGIVETRMKLYGLGIADSKNPKDQSDVPPDELEKALEQLKAMREAMKKEPKNVH